MTFDETRNMTAPVAWRTSTQRYRKETHQRTIMKDKQKGTYLGVTPSFNPVNLQPTMRPAPVARHFCI